jgi:hypothetical protein
MINILRDVDQRLRQGKITGVGCLKGGIGKTFTGT